MCTAIVTNILQLKKKKQLYQIKGNTHSGEPKAYPTIGTQSESGAPAETQAAPATPEAHVVPPPPMVPTGGLGCPGCHNRLRHSSPYHTRNPRTCRHPEVRPVPYACKTCDDSEAKGRNPRGSDTGHTLIPNECRFGVPGQPPRKGAHPRDPHARTNEHQTADHSSVDAAAREDDDPADLDEPAEER